MKRRPPSYLLSFPVNSSPTSCLSLSLFLFHSYLSLHKVQNNAYSISTSCLSLFPSFLPPSPLSYPTLHLHLSSSSLVLFPIPIFFVSSSTSSFSPTPLSFIGLFLIFAHPSNLNTPKSLTSFNNKSGGLHMSV